MYNNKFVLSIINNGYPIKESGSRSNKQVVIPFGSEYKIRLKNKNDRDCTAKVTIDGIPISNFGNIIVGAGDTVEIERFITDSMSCGKKFKFVTLGHSDVDDPTSSDNGIVKVEFKLAKKKDIKIDYNPLNNVPLYKAGGLFRRNTNDTTYYSSNVSFSMFDISNGATIGGSNSSQVFTHSNLDVESDKTILKLKMVGIKQKNYQQVNNKYCTQCCGKVSKNKDNYCRYCGYKL